MQLPFDLTIKTNRKQVIRQQLCRDTCSGDLTLYSKLPLICFFTPICLSLQSLMWLTDVSFRHYGRFYQRCNFVLFKQQSFHKFYFHPSYSWFYHTKGNKVPLYLHQISGFLSIMRQTLAGATLQIICQKPNGHLLLPYH